MVLALPDLVAFLGAAVALAATAASGFLLRQAWPSRVRLDLRDARDRVDAVEANLESLQAAWHAKQVEFEAIMEQIEDLLAATEKKRRRVAASASRAEAAAQADQGNGAIAEGDYDALRQLAVQSGYRV